MQLATERTRLHVDGVRCPITADVARRRDDGMVVMQPLPFLKLDTTVTESGRRSRIRRVAIAMDGDVPRLVLELCHDRPALEDDTLEPFTPGVSTRPARADSTVPYELATRESTAPRASIVVGPSDTPLEEATNASAPAGEETTAGASVPPAFPLARAQRGASPAETFWARFWRAVARALSTITAPASS
ncbi:MAG: hypothetical protein KC619_15910 [Myxococcales bacterium]|nr:hypothetical protein [Myxococcales bacterium]